MVNKMQNILSLLLKVPKGKVTTYGAIAKQAKTSPRAVGQVMRNNKQPEKYPCYKVIMSSGKIGGYNGKLSGKEIRRKIALLKKDGIAIRNNKIDLKKYLHRF
jgi:methylated-DNA-[protein]-cysteine S-methyltransferase